MKKKIIFAHLAILGANLIYAVNYGFAKDVMNGGYLPPFTFILFRAIGATFLFWITSLFFYEKILKPCILKIPIILGVTQELVSPKLNPAFFKPRSIAIN